MSIIGNAIMVGGGGGSSSVAVAIHGGLGETVSWSGDSSGSTTLSAQGDASIVLPVGGYVFTFSLGNPVTGGIAANIDSSNTVVNGWGDRNPAYWFGRTFGYSTGSTNSPTVSYQTNRIVLSDTTATTRTYYFSGITKGSHTQAKAYVDTTGSYNSGDGTAKVIGTNVTSTQGKAGGQSGVFLIGNVSANTTLGVSYRPSSSTVAGGVRVYALYLE